MAKFFQVGGSVRDSLLGIESKDIDYAVEAPSFAAMKAAILDRGGEIFVEHEHFLTIRAKVPKLGACDYVLCRKDGTYDTDGRRPDFVEPGTLLDDLARRDFTVNAMARGEDGVLVDPFGGQNDLKARTLRCVGNTEKRMKEDSLRMLRALRFAVTKGFGIEASLSYFLSSAENAKLLDNISIERIREELLRCFAFDTLQTLSWLAEYRHLRKAIFDRNLKLVPTIFVDKK